MSEPEGSTRDPVSVRGAELRTFLIADIRGYTKYTRERGDEAAAALTRQFALLVGAAVTDHEGTLVELRGDEALAVFVSPRQALRTALAIQGAVAEARLPGGVGIGLDAGEAIPVDGGYRGSALNLAARRAAGSAPRSTAATSATSRTDVAARLVWCSATRCRPSKGSSPILRS
jgi:class 3 adenylate cyclase